MSQADLARAEAEASDWFTRLKRTKISTDDLYGFQAWRRDPQNAAAFSRVERAWKLSNRLATDPDIQAATSAALRRHPLPTATSRWIPALPAAALLALVVAVLMGAGWLTRGQPTNYATGVGEQRLIQLPDGSRVRLNTDSAVRVAFTDRTRQVALTRGEAYFEVSHDAARPFIVEAGDVEVRALGTRFDVRRTPQAVKVVLVQGRVQVAHAAGGVVMLAPNQELDVTARGVSRVRPSDVAAAASWTTGRLTFRDMALRDAVAEVNRYAPRQIALDAPPEVAAEPVTGEFDVGDTQSFVTAVSLSFRLKVEPGPDGQIRLVAPPT